MWNKRKNEITKKRNNKKNIVWLLSYLVNWCSNQHGLSLLEIILAMGIFIIIVSVSAAVVIHSFNSNRLGEEETQAAFLASEGLEAVRSIKNQDFANLVAGTYEVINTGDFWQLGPTLTPGGKYQRKIIIEDVYRDENGEIVEFGGSLDEETKKARAQVNWQFSPVRSNQIENSTYFCDWKTVICFWLDGDVIGSGDTVVDSQHISAEARDVFVVNDYAYLVTDYALFGRPEFFIFDVTSPSGNLELVGSLNLETSVNSVYVAGDFAYLGTNNPTQELMVINISDPTNPQKVGYYDADPSILVGGMDVWVEGTKVYLTTRFSLFNPEFYILEANTSDPYNVIFSPLGSLNLNADLNGIFIKDNDAYLATSDSNRELQVIDIANPSNPQRVCWRNLDSGSANAVAVKDDRAYVVTEQSGSKDEYFILQLPSSYNGCPANPGSFITPVASARINADINDVFIYQGYVFVANENGDEELKIASLENPTDFLLDFNLHGKAYAVYVYGCLAYVATGNNEAELQVIQPK